MDAVLEQAWEQYRTWAATSRDLRARLSRWERRVLALTIIGTFLASCAPFASDAWMKLFGEPSPEWWRQAQQWAGWVGAACLALATYFASEVLSAAERQGWVRSRAAAEAMKSESYKYLMSVPPYDDPARSASALADKIAEGSETIKDIPVSAPRDAPGSAPPQTPFTLDDYVKSRVTEQIERFFKPAIARHQAASRRARAFTIGLGALATLLGLSAAGSADGSFRAVVLGTVTTAGAAIAAFYQGGRHHQLALNYQAVASQLAILLAKQRAVSTNPAKFIQDVEAVLQSEHAAWLTAWRQ